MKDSTSCRPLPPPHPPNNTHQPHQDHHRNTAPLGITRLRAPAAVKEEVKAVGVVRNPKQWQAWKEEGHSWAGGT